MTVDSSAHLLSQQQGGDLLLGGNKLTSFGLLQGFADEAGIPLDLCAWITLTYPKLQIHSTFTHVYSMDDSREKYYIEGRSSPFEVEAEVSEDGSTG